MTVFVIFKTGQLHLVNEHIVDSKTICEMKVNGEVIPEIEEEVRDIFNNEWLAILKNIPPQFKHLKHIKI